MRRLVIGKEIAFFYGARHIKVCVCVGGGDHEIYRPGASTGLKSSADLSLSVSLQTKHPF